MYIINTFNDFIFEKNNFLNIHYQYIDNLKKELSKFKTDEELLRSGGISNTTLDRLAFGFSEYDIKQLMPEKLRIRWKNDLYNVRYEIQQSGLSDIQWAKNINLTEPIDVDYWEDEKLEYKKGFYVQDGHHRYTAAKILNKPLNINLTIKINPIKEISDLDYDDFHRYVFKLYEKGKI